MHLLHNFFSWLKLFPFGPLYIKTFLAYLPHILYFTPSYNSLVLIVVLVYFSVVSQTFQLRCISPRTVLLLTHRTLLFSKVDFTTVIFLHNIFYIFAKFTYIYCISLFLFHIRFTFSVIFSLFLLD
jgi:hypothetical protein